MVSTGEKSETDLYLLLDIKIKSRLVVDLEIKDKIRKLLAENNGVDLYEVFIRELIYQFLH